MLKRILVPLDGSAMAERAVLIAGHLARAVEGSVVLLRVVSAPLDEEYERSFLYSASAELSPGIQLALQAATQYLKEATTFSELAGISTELVTTIGQTAEMIVAVAGAKEVDLIVMSSHDHTDVKYRVPGGVAHSVVRNAAVPVFVLHHKWHFHAITNDPLASFDRPFQVLVPLDGSASSEEVLELSARLASTLATPARVAIHLLRVVNPDAALEASSDKVSHEYSLRQAHTYLTSVAEWMRKGIAAELKLIITWSVILDTDVARAIIRVAEGSEGPGGTRASNGCDLIALATHGRYGLQLLTLGSIAERLLSETSLPVFIVREGTVAESKEGQH